MSRPESVDVEGARKTVAEALAERPWGFVPDSEVVAGLERELTRHAEWLLPVAQGWNDERRQRIGGGNPHLVGYGLLYIRRIMEYGAPDPMRETQAAYVWCLELARAVGSMVDLVYGLGEVGK
ncbi:hypothetical protein [Streptomyces syringium]|uniref:hypothetical protein n=1 Tax=Streptomyces syringium TaxID=76729 RepID=UPI0033C1101C